MENAKIAFIQFCLSSPKTDLQNDVVVKDYAAMDRILKEERKYIAELIKAIVKSGANVLMIQKSVMRDATNDLSLHFLAKKGILVIKDIERDDVPFITKTIGCVPVSHVDHLTAEKLGKAGLVEEATLSDDTKVLKISGVKTDAKTVTILVRGSNNLVIKHISLQIPNVFCRSLMKLKDLSMMLSAL